MKKTSDGVVEFKLDDALSAPEFELQPLVAEDSPPATQLEFFFTTDDSESPDSSPQAELSGMAAPRYCVELEDGRTAYFQYANNLLESLEAQHIPIHYQCREGYCGSCRVTLLSGEVHYTLEPMAWLNAQEILTCCAIPKTDLRIKMD